MSQRVLHISTTRTLPLDAATQTFAFIARKGAGKTYAAGKLVEELMDAKVQVVILDTVGNWYGLRLDKDGKSKGFDIPVFGGLRGDIPLQAQSGELVADVAVDTARSIIVDLSQFSLGDRKRFAVTFGERLWRRKKGESHPSPLTLVIEESQLIIPQFTRGGDEARMVGIYEEIIRLGRNYGIGVVMISQRPQSVNKEVLNQTECLFVGQVNGSQERKALKDWIVHQGMDPQLLDELPSLPIGTMYVWSPQWLKILEKIKIAPKKTFDASATPRVGDKTVRRDPAPLDLGEIEKQMASVIEKAKQDDPRELRRQLSTKGMELSRALEALEKRPLEKSNTSIKRVEVKVVPDSQIKALEKHLVSADAMLSRAQSHVDKVNEVARTLRTAIGEARQLKAPETISRTVTPAPRPVARMTPVPARTTGSGVTGAVSGGLSGGLSKCERAIMSALAQYPQGRSSNQVATLTGYSGNSGGFNNSLSKLRSSGFITRGNPMQATEEGLKELGDWEPLPTGSDLLKHWLGRVSKCERAILHTLADYYPRGLTTDELGEATGYSASSGEFNNSLSRLRTLELIGRGQPIVISEDFYQ